MLVTATDFKTNLGKYLSLVNKEDIYITKNGKYIAKLVHTDDDIVDSLIGVLKDAPADTTAESIREERLARYEIDD
ncbi:MAG TPA: type II toxin-antitoxin system prevent-host-death family antitoxin [Candidatus Ornithomonoglobus merdipullorum]|uniref:Antitoxin n=1 Tax=Candidatus Ornithomonoglobus merdipullorum TaxID=2840895 RepID=A0A9D1MBP4_9FIRM|nr:type II toxin-antitoxin system prevent-host-death family antitoxin [Candidatus Ornithomonoglobus merdipullorum]